MLFTSKFLNENYILNKVRLYLIIYKIDQCINWQTTHSPDDSLMMTAYDGAPMYKML